MGKNVIISGASGGFGRLIVEQLINDGHNVVSTMRGVHERNKDAAREIESSGSKVLDMDVTSERSVTAAVTEAVQHLHSIDVVINNAGVGVLGL